MTRFYKGDIKGIRAEYTPVMRSVFIGEKTPLKQNISLLDKSILSVSCIFGDRLYSLGLKVQTRNGVKQKIDIGYPPEDDQGLEKDAQDLPRYQFIRSLTFFGEIEDKAEESPDESPELEKSNDLANSQLQKSLVNNGEPLMSKGGKKFIYPENISKAQYIKLTGLMFDIVA